MPIPVPALLLGGAFIAGLLLLNKREKEAAVAGPTQPQQPSAPPSAVVPGLPTFVPAPQAQVLPPLPQNQVLPPLPGNLFPAVPFPGRPPPITVEERERIVAKPPGTLTAQDVANLTVDFTPQQTALLNTLGTPGLTRISEAGPTDISEAIRQGVSLEEMLKRTSGPIMNPRAQVKTNDPSPSGDLKVLDAPNASARQTGGAPKGGMVTIMNMNASPEFAEIIWGGGFGTPAVIKYPGVRGFVKKRFLVIQ